MGAYKLIELLQIVNGKIICRKMAKKNVVFPTFFVSPILWYNIIMLIIGGDDTNDIWRIR